MVNKLETLLFCSRIFIGMMAKKSKNHPFRPKIIDKHHNRYWKIGPSCGYFQHLHRQMEQQPIEQQSAHSSQQKKPDLKRGLFRPMTKHKGHAQQVIDRQSRLKGSPLPKQIPFFPKRPKQKQIEQVIHCKAGNSCHWVAEQFPIVFLFHQPLSCSVQEMSHYLLPFPYNQSGKAARKTGCSPRLFLIFLFPDAGHFVDCDPFHNVIPHHHNQHHRQVGDPGRNSQQIYGNPNQQSI